MIQNKCKHQQNGLQAESLTFESIALVVIGNPRTFSHRSRLARFNKFNTPFSEIRTLCVVDNGLDDGDDDVVTASRHAG